MGTQNLLHTLNTYILDKIAQKCNLYFEESMFSEQVEFQFSMNTGDSRWLELRSLEVLDLSK